MLNNYSVECEWKGREASFMVQAEPKEYDKEEFIAYLEETLIPDLRESGSDATADDFQTCVRFMRAADRSTKKTGRGNDWVQMAESRVNNQSEQAVELWFSRNLDAGMLEYSAGIAVWVPKSVYKSEAGVNYLRRWYVDQKRMTDLTAK